MITTVNVFCVCICLQLLQPWTETTLTDAASVQATDPPFSEPLISYFDSFVRGRFRLTLRRIEIHPIGIVRAAKIDLSKIIVQKRLSKALKGIKDYSHLLILFWMHEVSMRRRRMLTVHPRRQREIPLQGAFATSTPNRPNPIGVTVVKLLAVRRNVLEVEGLDALDGSPVLDIKPFAPIDFGRVRLPRWWRLIEGERKHPQLT